MLPNVCLHWESSGRTELYTEAGKTPLNTKLHYISIKVSLTGKFIVRMMLQSDTKLNIVYTSRWEWWVTVRVCWSVTTALTAGVLNVWDVALFWSVLYIGSTRGWQVERTKYTGIFIIFHSQPMVRNISLWTVIYRDRNHDLSMYSLCKLQCTIIISYSIEQPSPIWNYFLRVCNISKLKCHMTQSLERSCTYFHNILCNVYDFFLKGIDM